MQAEREFLLALRTIAMACRRKVPTKLAKGGVAGAVKVSLSLSGSPCAHLVFQVLSDDVDLDKMSGPSCQALYSQYTKPPSLWSRARHKGCASCLLMAEYEPPLPLHPRLVHPQSTPQTHRKPSLSGTNAAARKVAASHLSWPSCA